MADYKKIKSFNFKMTPSLRQMVYLSLFFLKHSDRYIEERGTSDIKKEIMDDILEKVIYPKLDYIKHPLAKKFMDHNFQEKPDITPEFAERVMKDVEELEMHPLGKDFKKEFEAFCEEMSKDRIYGDYERLEEKDAEKERKSVK